MAALDSVPEMREVLGLFEGAAPGATGGGQNSSSGFVSLNPGSRSETLCLAVTLRPWPAAIERAVTHRREMGRICKAQPATEMRP
jgi:hypothetical protein